jgi:hypothetical protein
MDMNDLSMGMLVDLVAMKALLGKGKTRYYDDDDEVWRQGY